LIVERSPGLHRRPTATFNKSEAAVKAAQARGIIFEEIVLLLLERVGYRIVVAPEDGTKTGPSGLEVQGRGEWHQVDALAAFDHAPPFMYPLRLVLEIQGTRTAFTVWFLQPPALSSRSVYQSVPRGTP
jgi:hypothetical protein